MPDDPQDKPPIDPDLQWSVVIEDGVVYVKGLLVCGDNQYVITDRLPDWIVRNFTYAARRVKNESAQREKLAKAQEHRERNRVA